MKDHGGRLTDSGQVVTDQVIPFSKFRGGWIQDAKCRWQRLIVPSGEEQVVRTGSLRSKTVATKESVIRIAQQCVNASNQPYDEDTMEVMTIIARFENKQIVDGGREQYEARLKLVDYILERKTVTEAGCRYCPHCLTETPMKFSVCVGCWTQLESHGLMPYRLDDQADDEDEDTKRQIDEKIRKTNESMFKDTVHEAQENAETQSQFGFDASEVDYGEGDEEMKEEEEVDVEIDVDEQDEDEEVDAQQEAADRETEEKTKSLPATWSMNLEIGTKKMPIKRLQNIDVSENAAQIFDNAVISKILVVYKLYYNQRVLLKPSKYHERMTGNKFGRMDIDGICPYTGEDENGVLKEPTQQQLSEWFEQKASETSWSQGQKLYGGRPRNMMEHVIKVLHTYEKMMEFLMQAGYTPERIQFLTPMSKMKGNNEEKGR